MGHEDLGEAGSRRRGEADESLAALGEVALDGLGLFGEEGLLRAHDKEDGAVAGDLGVLLAGEDEFLDVVLEVVEELLEVGDGVLGGGVEAALAVAGEVVDGGLLTGGDGEDGRGELLLGAADDVLLLVAALDDDGAIGADVVLADLSRAVLGS